MTFSVRFVFILFDSDIFYFCFPDVMKNTLVTVSLKLGGSNIFLLKNVPVFAYYDTGTY